MFIIEKGGTTSAVFFIITCLPLQLISTTLLLISANTMGASDSIWLESLSVIYLTPCVDPFCSYMQHFYSCFLNPSICNNKNFTYNLCVDQYVLSFGEFILLIIYLSSCFRSRSQSVVGKASTFIELCT